MILRLHLVSELSTVPPSVILKQSVRSEEEEHEMHQRFARDWAGLEFLNQQPNLEHIIPRFYGENSTCRFILQEDLGMPHISLVDSLTRPNKNEAVATLSRFMRALGRMHAAVRPRVLARLQAFSTIASQTHLLPHLNNLVHDMLATLHMIWENIETLKYYPSFMNREHS